MPVRHPHLDAAQLVRLRARLAKRLEELKREIAEGIHAEQREPAQIQRDADELNETTLALERLGSGDYGTCIDCGHAISWPRLEALPHAVRCITCEALFEKRKGAAASAG